MQKGKKHKNQSERTHHSLKLSNKIKKYNIEEILQNNWPMFFKTIKVMKVKLRNCHRLEKTNDAWQINATWDPELNPGIEKGYSGKTGEIWISPE